MDQRESLADDGFAPSPVSEFLGVEVSMETAEFCQVKLEAAEIDRLLVEAGSEADSAPVRPAVKEEASVAEAPPELVLRLSTTVRFKTSNGRVLTVANQKAVMTFGDFRKLFRIAKDTDKHIIFKAKEAGANGSERWEMATSDEMILPVINNVIETE